jgi:hypothetical protein
MLEFPGLELSSRLWNVLEHLRKYKKKKKRFKNEEKADIRTLEFWVWKRPAGTLLSWPPRPMLQARLEHG